MRLPLALLSILPLLPGFLALPAFQALGEDGAAAPPGCWTTAGGCPARTGVSLSEPLEADPVEAWRYGPATFEGEPLAWGRRVFATTRDSRNRRTLHILDVESGRLLFHRRFTATVPLEPSVWESSIALRLTAERAELFRVRGSRLQSARSFQNAGGVSAPLLFEDEIYLREGDTLVRYDDGRREPVWRAQVEGAFRGTPSLRGDEVWAVWYDSAGNGHVAAFDRRSGKRIADGAAGHHGQTSVPGDVTATLVVTDQQVFLQYPLPALAANDDSFSWGRLSRRSPKRASLHPFGTAPLPWEGGWIVLESRGKKHRRWLAALEDQEGLRARVLAEGDRQRWLVDTEVPGSRAGDLAYLGSSAIALDEYELYWRRGFAPSVRPVPLDGGVLWVVDNTLRAMRSGGPPPTQVERRASELEAGLDEGLANGLGQLAGKALISGDLPRTEALLRESENRGVDEAVLARTRAGLERQLAGTRTPPLDRRKAKAVDKEEQALRAEPVARLMELATRNGDSALGRELLRRVLEREPENRKAMKQVGKLVPRTFPHKRGEDARSWLEFLDVHANTPVQFTEDVEGWKRGVGGYRSDRLLVLTSAGRPGAVARSLEVGELVCDILEELFGTRPGSDVAPLTLHLYETREEYVEESQKARSGPEIALGWTAGHYSTTDNLSRMFVPEEDRAYDELLGVYAHELTHHWIATRAPFEGEGFRRSLDLPGYWVAEGFATLIEEFRLDPRRGTWNPENPRAASLDAIANATEDQLLSWELVLSASYADFAELSAHPDRSIPLTWKLGVHAQRSDIQMFYAQAGAAAHYFFNAEGGRYRGALLDYVASWYRGSEVALDAQRVFGLAPKKLGKRIRAHAKKTLARALE